MEEKKVSAGSNFLVQGSILAAAGLVVRLIGLLYKIPMTRILGDEGIGYYNTAYEIYNIGLILSSYSLPLAVERAVRFVTRGISVTLTQNTVNTEGILLEQVLSTLGDREGLGQVTEF